MDISYSIELIKIISCLFFLIISSFHDYRDRRVPNKIFKIFTPIAATLTAIDILLATNPLTQLTNFTLNMAISLPIFYLIYYVGLFGGADAKIMITLSIAIPWPPKIVKPLIESNLPIFPISILNDTILSSVLTLPYALLSNLNWKIRKGQKLFEGLEKESLIKKISALVFCIKTEKARIRPYHMIAEDHGKIVLFRRVQEEDLSPKDLEGLPQSIFVTFSLPMLIFITIGFITAIYLGDFVIFLVRSFLRL